MTFAPERLDPPLEFVRELPGGYKLYRQENGAGGHSYWSDEIGGGVLIWDTCLIPQTTLIIAMAEEAVRVEQAAREARRCVELASADPRRQ